MKKALKYLAFAQILKYVALLLYIITLISIVLESYVLVGIAALLTITATIANIVYDWIFIMRVLKNE